jgi:hypothetical protein
MEYAITNTSPKYKECGGSGICDQITKYIAMCVEEADSVIMARGITTALNANGSKGCFTLSSNYLEI